MKVYLAGPDVFLPDAIAIGQRKIELCARYGHVGLYPLENEVDLKAHGASIQIFRGNVAMMDRADAIIANLTPFRGPSADAGTVYELGYMSARGKICLGYSNDPALYTDRVVAGDDAVRTTDSAIVDRNGHTVEDFGLRDNLMILHALDLYGHPLVTPTVAPSDLWHDLSAFETCLRLLAQAAAGTHAQNALR